MRNAECGIEKNGRSEVGSYCGVRNYEKPHESETRGGRAALTRSMKFRFPTSDLKFFSHSAFRIPHLSTSDFRLPTSYYPFSFALQKPTASSNDISSFLYAGYFVNHEIMIICKFICIRSVGIARSCDAID